jgi:hypothetical protein
MKRKTELHNMIITAILAFVCAIVLGESINTVTKMRSEEQVLAKINTAISCGADVSIVSGHDRQEEKNSKNSCPHQLGDAACLCMAAPRQKRNHCC